MEVKAMGKVTDLLKEWQAAYSGPVTAQRYSIRLPIHDAARIAALAEMFPGHSAERIIADLLRASLDELEQAFPYLPGGRGIAEDEQGDPVYEDAGQSPRFHELAAKHARELVTVSRTSGDEPKGSGGATS